MIKWRTDLRSKPADKEEKIPGEAIRNRSIGIRGGHFSEVHDAEAAVQCISL